jgi:TP901 family phage tail tape measure protein
MAQVGVVYVDVQFDTSQIGANLRKTLSGAAGPAAGALDGALGAKLSNFGTNATRVGRQVSFGLSAPLLAIGTAAVGGFSKFESSMTKIETLVGESHAQVQAWSKDVRRIGVDFGVGAQEAADALYFITSSGLSGAQAIDALQVSAKASAVGLGDMTTIADLLTSALNAYGKTGLTATKAIDSLLVAIRLGKNEPADLAASMGRVFPIASKLGVSFQELAGSFAALSLNGTDADEAATQLRGILNSLLDPSKQARDQFAAVGLSVEGLQDSLANQGLLPTLQNIRDRFGDNNAAMANAFGNVRALTGVFTLLGSSEQEVADIMRQTKNATGELDRALDIVKETTEFKLNRAMASLKNSLIDVGESAAPVAETLANAGSGMARGFSALPSVVQTATAALGAFGIAAGPVIYSVGSLASLAGGFRKSWEAAFPTVNGLLSNYGAKVTRAADGTAQVTTAAQRLGPALAGAGVAVGGLVIAWSIWNDKMQEAQRNAEQLGNLFNKRIAKGGIDEATKTIDRTRKAVADLTTEVDNSHAPWDADFRAELEKYKDQLNGEIAATEKRISLSEQMARATGADKDALFEWLNTEAAAGRTYGDLSAAMAEFLRQQREGKSAVQVHTTALGQQQKSITQLKDAYFGVQSAERAFAEAQKNVVQAERSQARAARTVWDAYVAQSDAQDRVVDAERRRQDSLDKLATAQERATDAQRALNDALAGPSEDEAIGVDAAQLGLEEANRRLAELGTAKPGERAEPVDPLDRRRAELDVRRAQLELERAQGANAERVASAQRDLESAQEGVTSAQADAADSNKALATAHQNVADAADHLKDAWFDLGTADDAVRKAHEDLIPAVDGLATKQQEWADAVFASNGQIGPLIAYLEALKALYPQVGGELQAYIDKLNAIAPKPPPPPAPAPPAQAGYTTAGSEYDALLAEAEALGIPGAKLMTVDGLRAAIDAEKRKAPSNRYRRAYGGSLPAGGVSSVNELGMPELWEANGKQYLIPTTSGRVVPLSPLKIPVAGNDGGVQFGDIVVNTTKDAEPTAYAIRRGLRAEMFLQGKQR